MTSLVKWSNCALLAPMGVGPPRVRLGSTVSKPCPKAPYKRTQLPNTLNSMETPNFGTVEDLS